MSEPKIGEFIADEIVWAIVSDGKSVTDTSSHSPELAKAPLLQRMGCDWDKAYDLGFRLCQVRPQYRIMSVLIERPTTTPTK